jgi:quinol monooxygenase YgiN
MIIVTGSIIGRPESIDELVGVSLEHVRRSRAEPGCLAHAVHRDVENPLRLVFVEQWADRETLMAHFRVPASLQFVRAATGMAAAAPQMEIYEATPVQR